MKKLLCVLSAILVLVCVVSIVPVFSADTDFTIDDGVLLSYDGSDTSVTIPSSVSIISNEAFAGNTNIESVKFHDGVYSIGNKAFYGCTSLSSVSNADGVKYVGALAFNNTLFLTQSTDEFFSLGSALICYNGNGGEVALPSDIESISPYAFLRNSKITSFYGTDNLSYIGEGAFYECENLGEVNVGESVTFIGADAFYSTQWLDNQNGFVVLGDGILLSYKGSLTDVTIPDNIKQIAPNAFYANTSLVSLKIPSGVFAVGARAFMDCEKLREVEFSNGLIAIFEEAFAQCVKLETVTTPETLSKIGKGAFIKCQSLKKIFLRGNSLDVDYGAFAYCDALDVALLSEGVVSVAEDVFAENSTLEYITVPSKVTTISPKTFSNCESLTVITDKKSFADSALSGSVDVSYNRGDSNLDGIVDIMDATAIQCYIASVYEYDNKHLPFMDADFDAEISILDATYVQLMVARLI